VKFKTDPAAQYRQVAAGWKGRLKPSIPLKKGIIMFKKFFKDETGLELSEYAVAAALVAIAAVAAFQLLGTNIGSRINTLAGYIK
jgi:pilus assembly protein Flp/PilA